MGVSKTRSQISKLVRRKRRRGSVGQRSPAGSSPGHLRQHQESTGPVRIRVVAFDQQSLIEKEAATADELFAILDGKLPAVRWINVDGLSDLALIRKLGARFGLHPLALEDVVNTHQRPKAEDYGDVTYIVIRMPSTDEELDLEQVSLFVGDGWVLTFQERSGDCWEPVRLRIHKQATRIRDSGADYLTYALVDAIVDAFFPIFERYLDSLEQIERQLAVEDRVPSVGSIHLVRGDVHSLRRVLWPTRDLVASLARGEMRWVSEPVAVFLRDCHDHTVQLIDIAEACRDLTASLMDLHMATMSNRMNEVMKVLTLIATVFIPLSFVAGVYGMNFDASSPYNMPELGWRYGYPFALAIMGLTAGGFLVFFRRKGWLGGRG